MNFLFLASDSKMPVLGVGAMELGKGEKKDIRGKVELSS